MNLVYVSIPDCVINYISYGELLEGGQRQRERERETEIELLGSLHLQHILSASQGTQSIEQRNLFLWPIIAMVFQAFN
jgi:hypothetical protein